MTERVIVAVDGGPASAAALDWVIARARTAATELTVVSVADLGWIPPGGADVDYLTVFELALRNAAERIERELPQQEVMTSVLVGLPVDELVRVSASADLLVIGTNRPRPHRGVFFGTLTLRVAAKARCAVVVVPSTWRPGAGPIVVGMSADATDDPAIEFAVREATKVGTGLEIVHAVSIPQAVGIGELISPATYDELLAAHRTLLDIAAERLRAENDDLAVKETLIVGPAASSLVDDARDAAMIVVGTHRRNAIGSLILGSVSHDVLLNLPCPVAVVPPHPARTTHDGGGPQ